jgi:hypothetical protein
MALKRRLRKKRKKIGGELRRSVDKLNVVESGVRPVRQQTDLVRDVVEQLLREEFRKEQS